MTGEHYCEKHATKFFKTTKMSGYAHPIKDKDDNLIGWCNEDAEEVAKLEPRPMPDVPLQEEEEPVTDEMTKADWANKDRIKQHSIERQKALAEAVNWCIAKLQGGEEVKTVHIISIATIFESYLEDGNIKKED